MSCVMDALARSSLSIKLQAMAISNIKATSSFFVPVIVDLLACLHTLNESYAQAQPNSPIAQRNSFEMLIGNAGCFFACCPNWMSDGNIILNF
jgi:hypothetical protein